MSIDIIGISNFLNLILVNEYIKPTFLIPETICNNNSTPQLLSEITNAFPLLKQSINYKIYNGVIISYNDYSNYNGSSVSLQNIGLLLGYPFYENFNNTTDNYNTYTINVKVKLKNGLIENLFSNICHHITDDIIESFNICVEAAIDAFHKEKYITLMGETVVIDVYTEIIQNISADTIIEKLMNNKKLQDYDFEKIQHILIHLKFTHNFQIFFNSYFQESNNIHKGILIGLLLNSKHKLLSHFQEVDNYKETYNDIQNTVNQWEKNLTRVLHETRINNLFCLF
jgi:hypothetical protein